MPSMCHLFCCAALFAVIAREEIQSAEPNSVVPLDADYGLQGEYLYETDTSRNGWGLQVVALGTGRFQAALLSGGLPGYRADGCVRIELVGQKEADGLTLTSADQQTAVRIADGPTAIVAGATTGTVPLRKVNRRSPTLGAPPPPNSIVLFDGHDTQAFLNPQVTSDGWLKSGTELIPHFRDFTMHLEFMTPYMPTEASQGRGNSGIYIHSRYEVQILDSFGSRGEFNECGALYRYRRPSINMCLPPLAWQTYDIAFRAPRFDRRGRKRCHAVITLQHNGVTVHKNLVVKTKTGAGEAEGPSLLPIRFQDHNDPVHFRNVWLVPDVRANCERSDAKFIVQEIPK